MSEKSYPHRKRPIHLPAFENCNRSVIQFVTVCTHDRQKVLANDETHALFRDLWNDDSVYRVGRYVIMPDHLHLFCSPNKYPIQSLGRWVRFWKSRVATQFPLELDKKLWQRDHWDRQLRRGDSYSEKWQYVVRNPVRAGLVRSPDDWEYSGELYQLTWHD